MWDVPFDTNSNKIYIAFDSDQSYHFKGRDPLNRTSSSKWETVHGSLMKGFKLNYWFESIIHELGGFRQALFYLRDQLLADVRLVTSQMQKFWKFSSSKFQREYRNQTDRSGVVLGCPLNGPQIHDFNFRSQEFKTNGSRVLVNRVRGLVTSVNRAIVKNNRRCSKGGDYPVPCKFQYFSVIGGP